MSRSICIWGSPHRPSAGGGLGSRSGGWSQVPAVSLSEFRYGLSDVKVPETNRIHLFRRGGGQKGSSKEIHACHEIVLTADARRSLTTTNHSGDDGESSGMHRVAAISKEDFRAQTAFDDGNGSGGDFVVEPGSSWAIDAVEFAA